MATWNQPTLQPIAKSSTPQYLPCMNPSCKSFGHSHPNCRCWGSRPEFNTFAEGGEVAAFCSERRDHAPDCELYSDLPLANPSEAVAQSILYTGLDEGKHLYDSLPDRYLADMAKGKKKLKAAVAGLFEGKKESYDNPKRAEKLRAFLDSGGITQHIQQEMGAPDASMMLADGGAIPENTVSPITAMLPEHNMVMSAARGRANAYLAHLQPQQNMPKLAFDSEMKDEQHEKAFQTALEIASAPLTIISKMAMGRLCPEHVGHLAAMFPEVKALMDQAIMEQITEAQVAGEKPPYSIRQAMSLFLGVPLGSEMTPQGIQAAQMAFKAQQGMQQQGAPQGKSPKKSNAMDKMDDNAWTDDQAAVKRQQAER